MELVRFFSRRDVQVKRSRVLWAPPTLPEFYDLPEVLEPNPRFAVFNQAFRTGTVSRPSGVTGKKYEDVTDAYIRAVHSVLTGERVRRERPRPWRMSWSDITGFKTGPPARQEEPMGLQATGLSHPVKALKRKLITSAAQHRPPSDTRLRVDHSVDVSRGRLCPLAVPRCSYSGRASERYRTELGCSFACADESVGIYDRLDALADAEDAGRLVTEAGPLRTAVLEHIHRATGALSLPPFDLQQDPTILPTLHVIQRALPSQLEAITTLATSGDWRAVHLRLANQVRPLNPWPRRSSRKSPTRPASRRKSG